MSHLRLGPIHLADGISHRNALSFLYAAFFSVCLLSFISFMQPYVLNVHLGLSRAEQGRYTALLGLSQEIVMLALVSPFGALIDKVGRRVMYTLGLAWIGVGYFLYPLATSFPELLAYRLFFAVGAGMIGTAMATVLADTPRDESRGLMVGLTGTLQGLGVMFGVLVLSKLPKYLHDHHGITEDAAGRYTLWLGAGLCLLTALVCWLGLQRRSQQPVLRRERIRALIAQGLRTGRENPKLALAYLSSFAARGDLVVIGTYFSLWMMHAGLEAGLSRGAAMAKAGAMYGVAQTAGLAWGPIFGWLMDRVNRVTMVIVAMALAAAGYFVVGTTHDPFAPAMYAKMALLGVGELSAILAGQALLGQEAPRNLRGSVIGVSALAAAMGVLFATSVGGFLFDAWRPGAPFMMIAVVNLLVLAFAVFVRRRGG